MDEPSHLAVVAYGCSNEACPDYLEQPSGPRQGEGHIALRFDVLACMFEVLVDGNQVWNCFEATAGPGGTLWVYIPNNPDWEDWAALALTQHSIPATMCSRCAKGHRIAHLRSDGVSVRGSMGRVG